MKNLINYFAISLALVMGSCSNSNSKYTEQDLLNDTEIGLSKFYSSEKLTNKILYNRINQTDTTEKVFLEQLIAQVGNHVVEFAFNLPYGVASANRFEVLERISGTTNYPFLLDKEDVDTVQLAKDYIVKIYTVMSDSLKAGNKRSVKFANDAIKQIVKTNKLNLYAITEEYIENQFDKLRSDMLEPDSVKPNKRDLYNSIVDFCEVAKVDPYVYARYVNRVSKDFFYSLKPEERKDFKETIMLTNELAGLKISGKYYAK